jgi:diacylglycerol kinase family enzyme
MRVLAFAHIMAELCARSPIALGRPLRWTIITNPHAGGFTIGSRWKKNQAILDAYQNKARALPPREDSGPSQTARDLNGGGPLGDCGLIPTARPGQAADIAKALVDEMWAASGKSAAPFHLIITAGGDGTSLETLSALFFTPAAVRSNCVVLRLPMGTGNDGADSAELGTALELLIARTRIEWVGAVRLYTATAGKGPFLAFNILSVGLDAFVTHMTNKMKTILPGDSYKLWVDIASLFYDRVYRTGPVDLRVFDGTGGPPESIRETLLLLAVGESGGRTYGSQKKILPDSRNVCMVRQMSVWRKIALKDLFTTGAHADKPEVRLFNAVRVEFQGQHPILAQMDGETVLLQPADFPAVMELTEKVIPVLRLQGEG